MNEVDEIKSLLNKVDFKSKKKLYELLDIIIKKNQKNEFLIQRFKRNSRINANFVQNTVKMLDDTNKELKLANSSLKSSNQELAQSNEELEKFAHIASHDLKTPIKNTLSFCYLLEDALPPSTHPEILSYVKIIKESSLRMDTLIKSVLEFSRITKQPEQTQLVDVNALIQIVETNIKSFIQCMNGKIIIQNTLPTIKCYLTEIEKTIQNLIENGLKYNQSKQPTIFISSKTNDKSFELKFRDNGIGIDPSQFDTVTKMFTRLHRQEEYPGSGLGLAICQKAITRLSGQLKIENDGKSGTTFIVTIPKTNID